MKKIHHITILLAFVTVFSTVAPAMIFADDSIVISNVVQTSSHTGGQAGEQGRDGKDGLPGKNGQDGADGANVVQVLHGKSTATSQVKTVVNGETVTDITKTNTGTATAQTYIQTTTAANDVTEADSHLHNEKAEVYLDDDGRFIQTLQTLKELLLKYVNTLL